MVKIVSIICIVIVISLSVFFLYEHLNDNLDGQKNYNVPINEFTGASLVVEKFIKKDKDYTIKKSSEVKFIKNNEYNQTIEVYSNKHNKRYEFICVFDTKYVIDVKIKGE